VSGHRVKQFDPETVSDLQTAHRRRLVLADSRTDRFRPGDLSGRGGFSGASLLRRRLRRKDRGRKQEQGGGCRTGEPELVHDK